MPTKPFAWQDRDQTWGWFHLQATARDPYLHVHMSLHQAFNYSRRKRGDMVQNSYHLLAMTAFIFNRVRRRVTAKDLMFVRNPTVTMVMLLSSASARDRLKTTTASSTFNYVFLAALVAQHTLYAAESLCTLLLSQSAEFWYCRNFEACFFILLLFTFSQYTFNQIYIFSFTFPTWS